MASKLNKTSDLNGSNAALTTRLDTSDRKRAVQQKNRILDHAARNRRTRQQLAQLERDNFHDDPHANLVMHKKAPKFNDSIVAQSNGAGRRSTGHARIRASTWQAMLDEDVRLNSLVNYSTATAPPPHCVKVLRESIPIVHKPVFSLAVNTNPQNGTVATNSNGGVSSDANQSNSTTNGQSIATIENIDAEAPPPEKRKKRQTDANHQNGSIPDDLIYRTLLRLPARHFCCVCGFTAPYTCVVCGMRYCSSSCLGTHKDTRCLKWTA
jgi:hypothetical protein